MKIYYKLLIVLLTTIVLLFTSQLSYAGIADWTREEADKQAEQDLEEQEEKQKERTGKSDNTYLSNLNVDGYEISPSFNKDITNYKIEGELDVDKININAKAEDEKATIEGNGNITLNTGTNNIEIKVTAENGFTRIYYIIVSKKESKNSPKLKNISILAIDNENNYQLDISPTFNSDIYSYTCEANNSLEKVDIKCDGEDPETKIETNGDYSLPKYENVFSIKVSRNGEENIYKITIYNKKRAKNTAEPNLTNKNTENRNSHWIMILAVTLGLIVIIFAIITKRKSTKKTKH